MCTVVKTTTTVKKTEENVTPFKVKTITKHHEPIIEAIKRLSKLFSDDQSRCRMPLSTALVTTKAYLYMKIYRRIITVDENQFTASMGWFERFKHRAALLSVKLMLLEQECALSKEAEGA